MEFANLLNLIFEEIFENLMNEFACIFSRFSPNFKVRPIKYQSFNVGMFLILIVPFDNVSLIFNLQSPLPISHLYGCLHLHPCLSSLIMPYNISYSYNFRPLFLTCFSFNSCPSLSAFISVLKHGQLTIECFQ